MLAMPQTHLQASAVLNGFARWNLEHRLVEAACQGGLAKTTRSVDGASSDPCTQWCYRFHVTEALESHDRDTHATIHLARR